MQDAPVIVLQHPRQHRPRRKERRHEIHVENKTQVLSINLVTLDIRSASHASTINKYVNSPKPLRDLIHNIRDLILLRQINREQNRPWTKPRLVEIERHHLRALS